MSGNDQGTAETPDDRAALTWAALDRARVAVAVTDVSGRCLRVSQAFADVFGLTPADMEGHSYRELVNPGARRQLGTAADLLYRGQTGDADFDASFARRDGSTVHARISASAIHDATGRPRAFLVALTNLAEIATTRDALAGSEERDRRLVDSSPVGIVEVDEGGLVLTANDAAAALLGRRPPAMVGQPVTTFVPSGSDLVHALDHAAAADARDSRTATADVEVQRPDGTTRWIAVHVAALPGQGDRPARALFYLIDIHGRVLFQAATVIAQQRARKLADLSPDATTVTDDEDRIVYANTAFAALVKVSDPETLARRSIDDFVAPASREQARTRRRQALAGQTVRASKEEILASDSSTIPVEVSSSAYEIDGQPAVLSVSRDISDRVRAEAADAARQAREHTLVETIAEGVVLFDLDDAGEPTPLYSNQAAYDMFPVDPDRERNVDPRAGRYVDLNGDALDYHQLPAWVTSRTGEPVIGHVFGVTARRDEVVWVRSTSRPVVGPDGSLTGVVASMVDVTADERARQEVASAHARFAALIEHGSDTITVLDRNGTLRYASPAFEQLFGRSPDTDLPPNLFDLVHPGDRGRVRSVLADVAGQTGGFHTFECRVAAAGDEWRYVEMRSSNRLGDPAVGGIVINARDVTDRVRAADRLRFLALHDDLTELPNRKLLIDRLEGALARAARSGQPCAVLYLDLDHFKLINDSLGHAAGDRVLQVVADRLRDTLRQGDSVARLSGDEFVVLAEEVESLDAAVEIAGRIHEVVSKPVELPERRVTVGCSLGIALSDDHGPDALIQEADTALYRAKATGRGRWALYDAAMGSMARQRLDTEDVIRSALDQKRLVALFQPIVDLGSGAVVATEALARIRDPDGTLILPAEFISVAEESGLILRLGASILDQACAQQAAWGRLRRVPMPARVAVNLSPRQLNSPALVTEIEHALGRHALSPHQLCVELTETALIDAGAATQRNIEAVEAMGVALAIDDFGTGWSSLGYVRRFRVDTLKIDQSFVSELGTDADATAVVRAVIGLGKSLGLRTVAEGVASAEHARILRDLGCDAAQGHHFSRPELAQTLTDRWRSTVAAGAPAADANPFVGE